MAYTYNEVLQYLRDRNAQDGSAEGLRKYIRVANQARQALSAKALWSFDKKISRHVLIAPYSTGTVSVNANATAVTGSGTTFVNATHPSGHIGCYIRFSGQAMQYLITAVGGATSLTISPAYEGASNLSGVTYEIVDEEITAPTGLRSVEEILSDLAGYRLASADLDDIHSEQAYVRSTGQPVRWGFEWRDVSSYRTLYLRVNPAPCERRIMKLSGFYWPAELTGTTSQVLEFPDHAQVRAVYEAYLEAFLLLEQKDMKAYKQQLGVADEHAKRSLGAYQVRRNAGQRQEYSSGLGWQRFEPRIVDVSGF